MPGLYKNAPLKRASFEARFPGDLTIEAKRYEFQRLIKTEFPMLYVPNAALDKSPALQHYQFRKEDESATVSLSINSFVYTTTQYPGFDNFKADIERLWGQFSHIFEIPMFTRLGLRYINHLPIIRNDKNAIPLSRYVTANLRSVTPALPSGSIYDLGLSLVCGTQDGGRIRLLIQNEQSKEGVEVLLLDFDCSRQEKIEHKERQVFIETAHQQIEALFLDLISPEYQKIMEGETRE